MLRLKRRHLLLGLCIDLGFLCIGTVFLRLRLLDRNLSLGFGLLNLHLRLLGLLLTGHVFLHLLFRRDQTGHI